MNDYQLLDHYAQTQDWDKAIAVAHKLRHHSGFQMLAAQEHPIPPSHVEKYLKHAPKDQISDVLYNLAGNLHPDLSREQLRHAWSHAPDEQFSTGAILAHPNYQGGGAEEGEQQSGDFWNSYERKVEPSHFAAIKAMYTGEPEHIETHRGDKGHSDEHKHQTPHLVNHMIASQKAIMNDSHINKKMINGEPHITVYRGVGGSYAKRVKDSLGVTDHDEEKYLEGGMSPYTVGKASKVDRHKTVTIPSAHMSSWSLSRDMATRFATGRGEHDSEDHPHHLIMKKDVPLRDVLHTGGHSLYPGHNPVHSSEEEIVVAHPEAHFKVSSKDIEVGHPRDESSSGTDFEAPKKIAIPKPPKNPLIKSNNLPHALKQTIAKFSQKPYYPQNFNPIHVVHDWPHVHQMVVSQIKGENKIPPFMIDGEMGNGSLVTGTHRAAANDVIDHLNNHHGVNISKIGHYSYDPKNETDEFNNALENADHETINELKDVKKPDTLPKQSKK